MPSRFSNGGRIRQGATALVAGCLGMGVLAYGLVSKGISSYVVLYLSAALACTVGAFL